MNNEQANHKPVDLKAVHLEIDDIFTFNAPLTQERQEACDKIQEACKHLAHTIAEALSDSKEQSIAINNVLAAALWVRHGITRRQIVMVAVPVPDEQKA
jgi:hypothetical protein